MKNSEIHNKFEKKEIRDFLSMSIVKNFESDLLNKKETIPYTHENPIEWSIKDAENTIEFHRKNIELLKAKLGIVSLIKMNGWKEFDVSDETQKDLDYTLRMNFIGTEEEYNFLISSIK